MSFSATKLLQLLRCPACQGQFYTRHGNQNVDLFFVCTACGAEFPVIRGIPRLLLSPLQEALLGSPPSSARDDVQIRTALSFGFEWSRFPEMYGEWEKTFLNYMEPHKAEFFHGKKVLDAGCGNGRFAHYAAKYGAEVCAIDLGPAVEVAQQNAGRSEAVQVIQADLHRPPFAVETFDFIYSIGVLHHLPNPEAAFQNLLRYLRPGGEIQIYLYWSPDEQPFKRALLTVINAARKVTIRLPHEFVYALAFPAAVAAFGFFVWPYRIFRRIPGLKALAEKLPMKQYADFPFKVCVNDQLDRFSAPIENRYTSQEVFDWLKRAALEEASVRPNYGWMGSGRKPVQPGPIG